MSRLDHNTELTIRFYCDTPRHMVKG